MKRLFWLLLPLLLGACATTSSQHQDLVNRAVTAMGGADALAKISTLNIKGSARHWAPEQSMVAGGEMRLGGDSDFELSRDLARNSARVDWVRNLQYPSRRTFKFSEIVTPDAGFVLGVDSNARNRQNRETKPPAHAMSGLRLATALRELQRASPALLLEMHNNPAKVQSIPDIAVGSINYPAVRYTAGSNTYLVMFDSRSGLPARIRTLDYDNIWGDVAYDLVPGDWRTVNGVQIAYNQKYEMNGRIVADIRLSNVSINAPVAAAAFEVPPALKTGAAKPATGFVPHQWVLRRQFIGVYLDSEHTSFDVKASPGLRLNELASGVQHVVGGSHNSLIVEMRDHLIVFDAPISDWQSNWTLAAAKAKYPGKPVKYLVLTHHHMDHAGGLRAYLAQGATLVVGKGNAGHFRKVAASAYNRNPDLAARDLSAAPIIEVADKHVLSDGTRSVSAHLTENPHAAGMLIGYVADARVAFVTDIWSPGRDPLPGKITTPLAALVNAVRQAGISPLKFAGGHGSTGDYAPLSSLAGQ